MSSAYALTVEPGTPLGQDVAGGRRARARRRRPGREVRDRRRHAARGRLRVVRDLELGATRMASAGTTSSTGRRATTSRSARPRTATGPAAGGWNLRTPERYIDAVRSGASPEAGDGAPRRPDPRPRRRSCSRSGPGPASAVPPALAGRGRRSSRPTAWLERRTGTAWCSPGGAGCSPPTSPSASFAAARRRGLRLRSACR